MDDTVKKKSLVRNESSAWWCSCWLCLINQRMSMFSNRIDICAGKIAYFSFFYRNKKFPYKYVKTTSDFSAFITVSHFFPRYNRSTCDYPKKPRQQWQYMDFFLCSSLQICSQSVWCISHLSICIYCLKIYAWIFKNKSK